MRPKDMLYGGAWGVAGQKERLSRLGNEPRGDKPPARQAGKCQGLMVCQQDVNMYRHTMVGCKRCDCMLSMATGAIVHNVILSNGCTSSISEELEIFLKDNGKCNFARSDAQRKQRVCSGPRNCAAWKKESRQN